MELYQNGLMVLPSKVVAGENKIRFYDNETRNDETINELYAITVNVGEPTPTPGSKPSLELLSQKANVQTDLTLIMDTFQGQVSCSLYVLDQGDLHQYSPKYLDEFLVKKDFHFPKECVIDKNGGSEMMTSEIIVASGDKYEGKVMQGDQVLQYIRTVPTTARFLEPYFAPGVENVHEFSIVPERSGYFGIEYGNTDIVVFVPFNVVGKISTATP